jgi:parallel beta-helix repeat protein
MSTLKVFATDYFVRVDGSDSNPGKSNTPQGAWQTIDYAFSKLNAGDHLFINDGIYTTNAAILKNIVGSPKKTTTISAINRWQAVLTQANIPDTNLNLLTVDSCAYLVIDGLELTDPVDKGGGISIRNGSHHITVRNCYVHDCGCDGISARTSDYIYIEGNVVRGNSRRSEWNCSGISVWHPVEYDKEPGFHIVIRNNVAFENECELPFTPLGHENPTDGNGIIIDDFRNTQVQFPGQKGGYKAEVLIENNLTFNNGGRGINIYESENVTVRNNTSFHNMRIISKYSPGFGDVTIQNSSNVKLLDNIIVKNPAMPNPAIAIHCYSPEKSGNNSVSGNVIIGGTDYCGDTQTIENNIVKPAEDQDFPGLVNPSIMAQFNSIEDFKQYFGLKNDSQTPGKGMGFKK